jgi:hypothetical protein
MSSQTIEIHGKSISIPTGLFIGGEFRKAQAGKTLPVENPATGKEIVQVQEALAEDVDEAVRVARKTFKSKEFVEYGAVNRAKNLIKLADLMEEHFDELVAIEMLDTGKTKQQAANLDVPASIGTLRYYAGWADKILGQSNFDIPKVFGYTKREPVGVCGQIIPWNVSLVCYKPSGKVTDRQAVPSPDVHVENRTSLRHWQYCGDQVCRDNAIKCPKDEQTDPESRLSTWINQHHQRLRQDCRRCNRSTHGRRQSSIHRLNGHRPCHPPSSSELQPQESNP